MPKDNDTRLDKIRAVQIETFMYIAGWIFIAITLITMALIKATDINVLDFPVKCMFNKYLHIYCPGCGGTRAIVLLFRGEIIKSFICHPLVPYMAAIGIIFMFSHTFRIITSGRINGIKFHMWFIYAGIGIVITQWIIKLILLLVFEIEII